MQAQRFAKSVEIRSSYSPPSSRRSFGFAVRSAYGGMRRRRGGRVSAAKRGRSAHCIDRSGGRAGAVRRKRAADVGAAYADSADE